MAQGIQGRGWYLDVELILHHRELDKEKHSKKKQKTGRAGLVVITEREQKTVLDSLSLVKVFIPLFFYFFYTITKNFN